MYTHERTICIFTHRIICVMYLEMEITECNTTQLLGFGFSKTFADRIVNMKNSLFVEEDLIRSTSMKIQYNSIITQTCMLLSNLAADSGCITGNNEHHTQHHRWRRGWFEVKKYSSNNQCRFRIATAWICSKLGEIEGNDWVPQADTITKKTTWKQKNGRCHESILG